MCSRKLLEAIWHVGVARVGGYKAVRNAILDNPNFSPTHIVSVGKAASTMARAALDKYGKALPTLIVTKYKHGEEQLGDYPNITLIESAHPVPDENSLLAGKALLNFVTPLGKNAKLLMLASGGASSLAENLLTPNTLADLKALNEKILASGVDIHAMNRERKKISQIKDGKLLARFKGLALYSFLISDVEGDDINVIGSGIGDVDKNSITEDAAAHIVASNKIARDACVESAVANGLDVIFNEENLYGDVFDIAKSCASKVIEGPTGLYIFGGEPVIQLPPNPGEGGRNQALAVAMAREFAGVKNIAVLVGGTDGSDGPTGSAGGYVTGECWQNVEGGDDALKSANSGGWLRRTQANLSNEQGGLFVTGPTGTNVMDIMLVLKT